MKYLPILKWKLGERTALATLSAQEKAALLPVVEIIPPLWDAEEEDWKTDPQAHIERAVGNIDKSWGKTRIAVDLRHFDPDLRIGSQHPLDIISAEARKLSLGVVPVVSPTSDVDYRAAVSRMVEVDGTGYLLRVAPEDFLDDGGAVLPSLAKSMGAPLTAVDLVLDLGALSNSALTFVRATLPGVLRTLPGRDEWRTITVAGGAFPDSMDHKGERRFPRYDWMLWSHLATSDLPRMPSFGDYGVNDPEFRVIEGVIRGSANLRYTLDNEWFVLRGHTLKKPPGYEQFRTMCQDLVGRSFYCGASFSWGDDYAHRCSTHQDGPGNQSTWRKMATSHHIKFVLRQVAISGVI